METLRALLVSLAEDRPIAEIRACVHWTAVISRQCGLAATLQSEDGEHGEHKVHGAGHLHNQTARALAQYALSDNLLEASLGLAAINSLVPPLASAGDWNAGDLLAQLGRDKVVAVVGHFPFIGRLRPLLRALYVLELRPGAGDLPADAAPSVLPGADIVAITGSTLINHTFDGLLDLCAPHALIMVLGPSTPLSPVLFDRGVHILSGVQVVDSEATLRSISQGATFQQVQGARLVTLLRDEQLVQRC